MGGWRCRRVSRERIVAAATVVLHRDGKVFLVERPLTTRFFPGVWAFPGGKIDAADGAGEEGFRRGALRELEEETRLVVAPERLVAAGRLLTPPFGPVRFDTCFFHVALRSDEEPEVVAGEHLRGAWRAPADAVRDFERGLLPLAPPTIALLRIVAEHGVEEGARRIVAEDGKPHHVRFRIEPHPGVYTLPLATRTLPPATTTNAVVYAGARVLVLDPGPSESSELDHLVFLLRALEREGKTVARVALTHHHGDHVGGARRLADAFGCEVAAHAETAKRLPFKVDVLLDDGAAFDLGTHSASGKPWRVEAVHTPGHAPGHLAFVDRRWNHVAAGDLVSGVSTILVDPDEGDMGQYYASLERLIALRPAGVLPAHGPPMQGEGLLVGTLAHRRDREGKVRDALANGIGDVDAMLPRVYADTDPALWPLARRNLLAHLVKLEREGIVRRDRSTVPNDRGT